MIKKDKQKTNSERVIRVSLFDCSENVVAVSKESDILSVAWVDNRITLFVLEEESPSEDAQFINYTIIVCKDNESIETNKDKKYLGTVVEPFTTKFAYHVFYHRSDK